TDTAAGLARVVITVAPGGFTHLGAVTITSTPRRGSNPAIPKTVVQTLSGLHEGNVYRERDLVNAQRTLYATDAFRHVEVSLDTSRDTTSGVIPVFVHVDEGYMYQARVGG